MANTQPIGAATAAVASTTASANSAIPTQSEFLKLLVTQMQHQDPLSPQDNTAFVAQLAQFASLEQAQNQTQLLTGIRQQLQTDAGSQAVGLVGKQVVASFRTIQVGGGSPAPLQFTLDSAASSVTLTIKDAQGNVVRTLTTGALPAGPQLLPWDGKNASGVPLPQASYAVAIAAANSKGGVVGARPELSGRVTGVSYATGSPMLILPGVQVNMSDVIQVSN